MIQEYTYSVTQVGGYKIQLVCYLQNIYLVCAIFVLNQKTPAQTRTSFFFYKMKQSQSFDQQKQWFNSHGFKLINTCFTCKQHFPAEHFLLLTMVPTNILFQSFSSSESYLYFTIHALPWFQSEVYTHSLIYIWSGLVWSGLVWSMNSKHHRSPGKFMMLNLPQQPWSSADVD